MERTYEKLSPNIKTAPRKFFLNYTTKYAENVTCGIIEQHIFKTKIKKSSRSLHRGT
jgi:hypothetical protein